MDRRNGVKPLGTGLGRKFISLLAILVLAAACSPGNKSEELSREMQDLKKEVKALQEKVDKLQASQQVLLEFLKRPVSLPEAAAPPPQQPQLPPEPQPLTVSQLLAGKDQYLGNRVTVKGPVGPVLVHHKSMLLKAPEGMVEVLFAKLPDQKVIQQLTSTTLDKPVTVTGVVTLPPRPGVAKLQINAEAVDF